MTDNVGPYASRGQLLPELARSGVNGGTLKSVVLAGKALQAGTVYQYTYAGNTPAVNDWIVQNGYSAQVIAVDTGATTVQVDDGTDIINGVAKLCQFAEDYYTGDDLDALLAEAMDFIDRGTQQWFNKRTYADAPFEGDNTRYIMLGVPIIEVTSLKLNDDDVVLDPTFYRVFSGRAMPDDRANPKIELITFSPMNIFSEPAGLFLKGSITKISGSFGYLEADGSTPRLIQRATVKMAVMRAVDPIGTSAKDIVATADVGPLKSEKTDLNSKEYYNPNSNSAAAGKGFSFSGDDEIDKILKMYRAPIMLGGQFPDIGRESPIFYGGIIR